MNRSRRKNYDTSYIVEKKPIYDSKGSDGNKNLNYPVPKDKLKKDSANITWSIIGAVFFERRVQLYEKAKKCY